MEWIIAITALIIGGILGWFLGSSSSKSHIAGADARVEELRKQVESAAKGFDGIRKKLEESESAKVTAETRVVELEKHLAEQKELLELAKTKLSETFKSLAADALSANNTSFLTLADAKFKTLKEGAASDLEARKTAIQTLVDPLSQALSSYQEETRKLENKRIQENTAVGEQLKAVAVAQSALQSETAKLVNALRSPQVRGRWGEIALRKTAELAGMTAYCDFVEQESVTTEDGRLRPDMIVKLPAGREVVVDSKVSLEGFMDALEAKTDQEREAAMFRHSAQLSQHVARLADKAYWEQFPAAPEFVVLFIPNDSFLAAAAEKNPNLVEAALTKHVVIATPATFIALLRAIAFGWRQERLAENAQRISELGQELSDRIATLVEYLNGIGSSLEKAVESFNDAAASLERRLLPSARKFKELGAGGKKEIDEVRQIDPKPRVINTPEDANGRQS